MNFDNDDALDRALFALPLEEPPADLRAAILSATIYRPAPVFSFRELVALAAIAAVLVWLVAAVILGGGSLFVHSLQALGVGTLRTLSNTSLMLWAAAGGATAIWLSIFTGFQPRTEGKTAPRR
ncbi:MAG: hypothetical protein ABR949_09565 [Candidatus Aquilonibacter sp.]|jgi:hypothetical protein